MQERLTEKTLGIPVDDKKTLGKLLLDFLFRAFFCFLYLHIILIGKPPKGLHIGIFFMFHQKTDGVSTSAATKAFVNFLNRGDGKGGRFFVMEGA